MNPKDPESKGFTPESKGITPESKGITPESKGITPESKGITPESKGITPESKDIQTSEKITLEDIENRIKAITCINIPKDYYKEKVEVSITIENVRKNFNRIPEGVFEEWLAQPKYLLKSYWLQEDPAHWIDKYINIRYDYLQNGDTEALGILNHRIDQFYARYIGHMTGFHSSCIPPRIFKIKEDWEANSVWPRTWNLIAGLAMKALWSSEGSKNCPKMIKYAKQRWWLWAAALPIDSELFKFVFNITRSERIFYAFYKSWIDPRQHNSKYIKGEKLEARFCAENPRQFYTAAADEEIWWHSVNAADNTQGFKIHNYPPWILCAWVDKYRRIMKDLGYSPNFDCTRNPNFLKKGGKYKEERGGVY